MIVEVDFVRLSISLVFVGNFINFGQFFVIHCCHGLLLIVCIFVNNFAIESALLLHSWLLELLLLISLRTIHPSRKHISNTGSSAIFFDSLTQFFTQNFWGHLARKYLIIGDQFTATHGLFLLFSLVKDCSNNFLEFVFNVEIDGLSGVHFVEEFGNLRICETRVIILLNSTFSQIVTQSVLVLLENLGHNDVHLGEDFAHLNTGFSRDALIQLLLLLEICQISILANLVGLSINF